MIQRYRVLGRSVAEGDELQHVLREAYERKSPVLCECRKGTELPLYISHRQNGYVLARWPGSGARHATACDHYDAPDYLTGMGQVRGSAVLDDEASGETSLKLGFPLSRGAARLAPAALTNDKPTVKSSGQKLSMRGLLHVLWDRAELTHWHPKMAGKRTWFVVRRALLEAAASCRAKQEALPQVLFVPESFKVEEKEEIRARRRAALARVYASRDEMMVVVGEIKEIVPAHGAERIVLRHVGDMPFVMDQDMARRFHKRFAGELALWQAQDGPNGKCGHLVLAGSFARRREGTFDLIEVALMPVTPEWLRDMPGSPSTKNMNALLKRLRFIRDLGIEPAISLATTGFRFGQFVREGSVAPPFLLADYSNNRRRATLAAAVVNLEVKLADAAILMFERLIGGLFTRAKRGQERRYQDTAPSVGKLMRLFGATIAALDMAEETGGDPLVLVDEMVGWHRLMAARPHVDALADLAQEDTLVLATERYATLRRFSGSFLDTFTFGQVPQEFVSAFARG